MPFNERITNHRRLMKAALYKLICIENEERELKDNSCLLMDRKIRLIDEYGQIMDELANTIYTDASMPHIKPPNMVELAEEFYKTKINDKNKGVLSRTLAHGQMEHKQANVLGTKN